MADDKVNFELVAPERLVMEDQVDMVVVPGSEGNFGVLPGHSALISTLRTGVIDVHEGGSVRDQIFVAGGFAEVTPERCTVLAERAVMVGEIDREAVEGELADWREQLTDADDEAEKTAAEDGIRIAEAMLEASASGS